MAAYKEILSVDAFTMFGTADQAQDVAPTERNDESTEWPQAAVALRTQ